MAYVYILVQNSDEEVRLSLDHLPNDASDILNILKAEEAPLHLWLTIAREYFKQGKLQQFQQILQEGSSPDIDKFYADVTYERIAILNALGAYHTYHAKVETKAWQKEEHYTEATQCYNKASRIDVHEPSTWIGKGQLLLAKGELEQAYSAFKIVLDGDHDNIPAILGQACVHFNRKRYVEALDLYKKALKIYPNCPAPVRLGLGFCYYELGRIDKARQAFQRVLELDHDNVEALVALGVMDLQTSEANGIHEGMEKMRAAFGIYPYCAMALNHIVNHFFFMGQHYLVEVEDIAKTAVAVSENGQTKSHSYYNLGRLYHSKDDYETAGQYYKASVEEKNRPKDFVLPYFGLGQIKLKKGDLKGSLSSFEKVLKVYPENCESLKIVGHIYVQLGQTEKALEVLKKATRINPSDAQGFLELGELLISSDTGAALDAFQSARGILKKSGKEASIELLNNIGVLCSEKGEFELAEQTFKEALGDGVSLSLIDGLWTSPIDLQGTELDEFTNQYINKLFLPLEEQGISVDLQWDKVTTLFNYARLLEQIHNTVRANVLYRLILFKYPKYQDAWLRLAAIAKSRNDVQLSLTLIKKALEVNENCPDAYLMRGALELKNDDFRMAKATFSNGKDLYTDLSLGNLNYFAAVRSEKRERDAVTFLEKAKKLYTNALQLHPLNLFAANGVAMVLAEKGKLDVSKDIFMQAQEAASGNADVWINLGHVYFGQGQFELAAKMYQNCLRKFYYSTDTQALLYLARVHYVTEQWQDCKKTLLRAIHMEPSNYALRFNAGVAMQKFSEFTLRKAKRTANELRLTVSDLRNALRVFSQLSPAVSSHHTQGINEEKLGTHVQYCKQILKPAEIHCEAAEREEQQNRQRLEVARQMSLAEEARRKAEEQRKYQLERRKQEEEIQKVKEQEEYFARVREQWKNSTPPATKRKERQSHGDGKEDEGGPSEKKKRKGGKKKKQDKKSQYEILDEDEPTNEHEMQDVNGEADQSNNEIDEKNEEDNAKDVLAAAGLEDSDVEEDPDESSHAVNRRRLALSESDEEDPSEREVESDTNNENLAEPEGDGEHREETESLNRDISAEENED